MKKISIKIQKIIYLTGLSIIILIMLAVIIHSRNKRQSDLIITKNSEQKTATKLESISAPWVNFTFEQKEAKLKTLTPTEYKVTQESATEIPFKNAYTENTEAGIYVDIVSGEPLFLSNDKFDSGTGWPSFVKPITGNAVTLRQDDGLITARTEVRSKIANSHLGHVFNDGPIERGGLRYCLNSAALRFVTIIDMGKEGYGMYIGMIE